MKFEVRASSPSGVGTTWTSQTNHLPPITISVPPEFMGPGGGFSPEDLFGMSVLNCIIATFKVYAEKANATFSEIKGKAVLTVDKQPDSPSIGMTHIDISLDVVGASDQENIRKLLDKAIKECAVSNSIKSGKTFQINVNF